MWRGKCNRGCVVSYETKWVCWIYEMNGIYYLNLTMVNKTQAVSAPPILWTDTAELNTQIHVKPILWNIKWAASQNVLWLVNYKSLQQRCKTF